MQSNFAQGPWSITGQSDAGRYITIKAGEPRKRPVRCAHCNRFIASADIESRKAKFRFIPLSEFGPEESYWECKKCA